MRQSVPPVASAARGWLLEAGVTPLIRGSLPTCAQQRLTEALYADDFQVPASWHGPIKRARTNMAPATIHDIPTWRHER